MTAALTTAYATDGRVKVDDAGTGFTVTTRHGEFYVLHTDVFAWGIYHGPNLDILAFEPPLGLMHGITEADMCIRFLLEWDDE